MKIIACCKAAPEEQDIVVKGDGSLDFSRAAYKFGSYDLNAIEAARVLADQAGGEVIGLCVGGEELANSKLRKDGLSRGLDELAVVSVGGVAEGNAAANLDSYQTASQLVEALGQLGGWDLVLCGAGSSDLYAQQVGNQLGALLGVPALNAVDSIELDGASGANAIVIERVLEHETQRIRVALPAVLSVTSGINIPRIAGMKDILAAGKKPVQELAAVGLTDASVQTASVLAPPAASRKQEIIEGDAQEAVARLLELAGSSLR